MNDFQKELFAQLEALVASGDTFYRQEFTLDTHRYWIYNYRLASYTEFLKPGGIECRGIMFDMNIDNTPWRLASMPMEKFWNLNENPATMNLDLTQIDEIELKADGSLMSTYMHDGSVRLKSKGSLFSEQALHAMNWLQNPDNRDLYLLLEQYATQGYTVNLEWCAPQHRIVIGYMQPHLKVLNVRSNCDGSYLPYDTIAADRFETFGSGELSKSLVQHWVDRLAVEEPVSFVASIPDMVNIEGYVVRLKTGQRIKIKTMWYLALHHTKDSVNSPRRLYETVLAEASDDLRAMFHDDPLVIQRIEEMEKFVEEKYNNLVAGVTNFHAANKDMVRKDYAILGQKELDRHQFSLAMRLYLGQEVNFKQYMADRWKEYGIKDDPIETEVFVDA